MVETQNQESESAGANSSTETVPNVSAPVDIIQQAKTEREANEKLLAEIKAQTEILRQMHVKAIMGGTAQAGSKAEPPKTREQELDEKAQEMADNFVKKIWGKL